MRLGDLVFDTERGVPTDRFGAYLELSTAATGVLCVLVDADGAVVSKRRLLDTVWPDTVVSEDSLYRAVADLRRAMGGDGRDIVRTVSRKGYRLVPPDPGMPAPRPRLRWAFAALGMAVGVVVTYGVMAFGVHGGTPAAPANGPVASAGHDAG